MDFGTIIMILVAVVVFRLLSFLLFRELHCWYEKRNEQLAEARKTNQLLMEIRGLLLQRNTVSGVAGNDIGDLKYSLSSNKGMSAAALPDKNDFTDLPNL